MNINDYDLLYDLPDGEYDGRGIGGVRTVTYRAGQSLEVMCYPLIRWSQEARREAKRRKTSAAMARINARNRERKHARIIEANFTKAALVTTLVYNYPPPVDYRIMPGEAMRQEYQARRLPECMEDVKRDMRRFFVRLRRRLRRVSGAEVELKWDLTAEEGKNPPADGLPPKYHIHTIIEATGLTREIIAEAWRGEISRCEHLGLNTDGAARLARYLDKGDAGRKWWSHSRNLKIPQPRVSDRRVSRRRLSMMARDIMRDGREILEAIYPGYRLAEVPEVRFSDFVAGAYIYARMRRRE